MNKLLFLKPFALPLIVFLVTTVIWIVGRVPITDFITLGLGLALGSIFLETDHLLYWFYRYPQREESRLAKLAFSKKDVTSFIKLYQSTRTNHTDLIFHHFIFHIVLLLVSVFVFTSTNSVFGKSFLLALNLDLLIKEWLSFQADPNYLRTWLFARLTWQLPLTFIKKYLYFVICCLVIFYVLLLQSVL